MRVQDLLAYQLVPSVVAALQASWPEELSPLQVSALRAGLLGTPDGAGPDLVLAGTARSGRRELGELLIVHGAHSGQRVLFVGLTETTADGAFRRLLDRYGGLGLRLQRVTPQGPGQDPSAHEGAPRSRLGTPAFPRGEFDVAVLSCDEALRQLAMRPGLLSRIDLVVVEGIETLCDRERGMPVELLLTWLKRAQAEPQRKRRLRLCALSEPAPGLRGLADVFNCQLVEDESPASEARIGVLCGPRFTHRTDAGALDEEILADGPQTGLPKVVADLVGRGETALVLAPDRARCIELAHAIAAGLPKLGASATSGGSALDEPGQARELLLTSMAHGVAIHHADLTPLQRSWVEQAVRTGAARVILSTDADALPADLMFDDVIHAERWSWRYSRKRRSFVRAELTPRELERSVERLRQRGGAPGRVLLCAPSRLEAEVWQRELVDAAVEGVQPTLLGQPLGELTLALIAGEVCVDAADVKGFLLSSYTGRQCWWRTQARAQLVDQLHTTVEDLIGLGLLARPDADRDRLIATSAGHAVAASGLPLRAALLLCRWVDAAATAEFTALEVLLVLALSASGGAVQVPMLLGEQQATDYPGRLLEQVAAFGAQDRPVFRWLAERAEHEATGAAPQLTFEQARATKKALLLLDWMRAGNGSLDDALHLEARYDLWIGTARRAALEFARLGDALAQLCTGRGWTAERTELLTRIAEQLRREPGTEKPRSRRAPGAPSGLRADRVRKQLLALRTALSAQTAAVASTESTESESDEPHRERGRSLPGTRTGTEAGDRPQLRPRRALLH